MGAPEIAAFLTWLATNRRVSASTQNQALSALLFLYRDVLHIDVGAIEHVPRARMRSEEHTSELQSLRHLVCRLLLEKKNLQLQPPGHHPPDDAGKAALEVDPPPPLLRQLAPTVVAVRCLQLHRPGGHRHPGGCRHQH